MSSISTFFSENCNFRPSSALPKALCLIPVVGSIVQFIQEKSILSSIKELTFSDNKEKIINLVKLKNEYKAYAIGGIAIAWAAVITGFVLGILSPLITSFVIAGLTVAVGFNAWGFYENKSAIILLHDPKTDFVMIR